MAFQLRKTSKITRDVPVVQYDESGKELHGKLKTRFNITSRQQWEELTKTDPDDDRLIFDVLVDAIDEQVNGPDGNELTPSEALAAVRSDLSLTAQLVDYGIELIFGAAAKNARRSRAR